MADAVPFSSYLRRLQNDLRAGRSTERSHYSALQSLIEGLNPDITATTEPTLIECGGLDFIVTKGPLIIGHIEAKDVGKPLDDIERGKGPDGERFVRYLESLPNLILTDYLEFRWYTDRERRLEASLGRVERDGTIKRDRDGIQAVRELLQHFFEHEPEPIGDSKALAVRMARKAQRVRDLIITAFETEPESGALHAQRKDFQDALIPDLSAEQFADMYAQTIAYGLFAARCQADEGADFTRQSAAYLIPKTNPFLRKLFGHIAGPELDERVAWMVDSLAQLLAHALMHEILEDFGRRTRREDPVVHFYETFLAAYDPEMREMRGVYYTPEAVVSYIVRSIDHILKTRFGRSQGLADPNTLILDPASGTGTFLWEVVRSIHASLVAQGQAGAWSNYVTEKLLPRLFGFELLMAPYAVAHLKMELLLNQTGYEFEADQRLGIYLTNTLEEAKKRAETLGFAGFITEEGNAAAEVKKDKRIEIILGNPPYSGHSANRSWREGVNPKTGKKRRERTWIGDLIQDYYQVDGQPLGERNPKWLQDDYVKFIRFAQWRLEETGQGILGFVTNHSYLDNPTFRGMRQSLMESFSEIHILDLHGSTRKRERAPDGSRDEPVFNIQQGVAIILAVREPERAGPAEIFHYDIYGLYEEKERFLGEHDVESTDWATLEPRTPYYLFVPMDYTLADEYERGWKVTEAMHINNVGIVTSRDAFVIDFDEKILRKRVADFLNPANADDDLRKRYLGDRDKLSVTGARRAISKEESLDKAFVKCLYRPFDIRSLFYHDSVIERPRSEVMSHVQSGENLGICIGRAGQVIGAEDWDILFCTRNITEFNLYRRGGNNLFPLYLYSSEKGKKILRVNIIEAAKKRIRDSGLVEKVNVGSEQDRVVELICKLFPEELSRWPNLDPDFIADLTRRLRLKFLPDGTGDLKKTFGPEDLFHYMYAVFHSPTYRGRYSEFLKIDFPRLPLTSDKNLFAALAENGAELVALHLMESPALDSLITGFKIEGSNEVEKVRYDENARRVYINKTQYFEGVPPEVWEFHVGGYQVCAKWLKDRRGRNLTFDDIQHYQKIVVALSETRRLMAEVDEIIPTWPIV